MFPAVTDRIPHRPPFLFVDEIMEENADGLVARRTWRPGESFYEGHYPNGPITPGVLLCESVFQTAALYLAGPAGNLGQVEGVPLIVKISDVRFRNPVFPGETTTVAVKRLDSVAGFTMMSGTMVSGTKRVLTVQFSVAWRVPMSKPD
jgi:3-hydroxyacyl-[acyl-carrier-protein] dehydratase